MPKPGTTSRAPGSTNGTSSEHHAWYDQHAEQQLLVELLAFPNALSETLSIVHPNDLSPVGGNQLQALIELVHEDGRTTAHLLAQHPLVDNPEIAKLEQRASTGAWRAYAKRLAQLGRYHRFDNIGTAFKQAARDGDDDAIARTITELASAPSTTGATAASLDVDELLNEPDADYDWLIPGLLERGDRLIVTGEEGKGKSTLLRQIAQRVSAGQQPFTGDPIDPISVLYVDCENTRRQVRRHIAKLRAQAGDDYKPGHLRFEFRLNGIDLLDPIDAAWLNTVIEINHPELVIIGPLYKLAGGDPIKEEPAREVANLIDTIRARTSTTFIVEAHTPYADGSKSKRPIRPYGASLWSRWPEFGFCLTDTGELKHWRGAREERSWPAALERSEPWPWAPRDELTEAAEWHGPTACADAIVDLLEQEHDELSTRTITTKLRADGRSFRNDTIATAAEMAVKQGRLTVRRGPHNARLYRAHDQQEEIPLEKF